MKLKFFQLFAKYSYTKFHGNLPPCLVTDSRSQPDEWTWFSLSHSFFFFNLQKNVYKQSQKSLSF